jgi:hypothetical protein
MTGALAFKRYRKIWLEPADSEQYGYEETSRFVTTLSPHTVNKLTVQPAGLPSPAIQRANETMGALESSSGKAVKINPNAARQVALFPETNPLVDELRGLDVNGLSPIEALNKLFEWQRKFTE